MARSKSARRFEPRGGVSQSVVEHECRYVGQELDDYLLYSLAELRQMLSDLPSKLSIAEEELQDRFRGLPDRERLALRCLVARDQFYLAMLYKAFFASGRFQAVTGASTLVPEELSAEEPKPLLVFRRSLFD